MADRLATLMEHFSVTAEVFHAGALCGTNTLETDGVSGQMHLVRRGTVKVIHHDGSLNITQPSLLLYARPMTHRFITDLEQGADMACASLRFEGGAQNPIAASLPNVVCLPLDAIAGASQVLDLLFEEAFTQHCGRVAVVNRLFEVVMIQILRQLMENNDVKGGMLAGLSHPRLRNALVAIHEEPTKAWTLDTLAERAGMSRSVFASSFNEVVGTTPGKYLQGWRIRMAQQALKRGRPIKIIAGEVGYGSEVALSRAFKAYTGMSPRQWREAQAATL
ncbi:MULTISPECIES: AraC family transcriptional regulator [unclassified Halomonas]|uniref:AraC family transcriptional regulator n=1 Tax=unclassified Halomonas TaxID=2609666 RepID=UPI001CF1D8A0|nr:MULTISPECIES: AraC family transcriptional regulator [unclassified Halomonas]MCA8864614.1 AraC family transcriptional regulator [Halomonas sp. SBBP1]UZH12023.1 AraC family transcriptional regulator [Halomonas sp. BDJS001]